MIKGQKRGQVNTHCQKGHLFTEDNIIWRTRDRGRGIERTRICKVCHSKRGYKYRSSKTYNREYRNQYARQWRKDNIDKVVESKLQLQYGIGLKEYNDMLVRQDYKCLICDKPSAKKLVVDHCHAKGHIRGLLCASCNMRLGWYEMNKDRIDNYL